MGDLPEKPLRKASFKPYKDAHDIGPSKNGAEVVIFTDPDDNLEKAGIFKPLGQNLSLSNANISVAVSVLLRLYLGDLAADERLVFDDADNAIGILSVKREFKAFATRNILGGFEPNSDTAPDTSQLAQANMMQLLIFFYALQNADGHPGNTSLSFMFDFDWCFATIVLAMKGPTTGFNHLSTWPISDEIFANFPASCADFCPHHLTKSWPGTLNPGKRPYDPEVFRRLAQLPLINGVDVEEQYYLAWLKFFVFYQPDIYRQRLIKRFGQMPLNYYALPLDRRVELETRFPKYFNEKTNTMPFVDVMLLIVQDNYDELSRGFFLFNGVDKNNFDKRVSPLWEYISRHPSVYRKLESEFNRLNEQTSDKLCIESFKRRYHQVFRDSFIRPVRIINSEISNLFLTVQETYSLPDKKPKAPQKTSTDKQYLTTAWALIYEDLGVCSPQELDCAQNSRIRKAYDRLKKMQEEFLVLIEKYFKHYAAIEDKDKKIMPLTDEANILFIQGLKQLLKNYNDLPEQLMRGSTCGQSCDKIISKIGALARTIDFQLHLIDEDKNYMSKALVEFDKSVQVDFHDDALVVETVIKALFEKLKLMTSKDFENICRQCFSEYNQKVKYCNRPPTVEAFLNVSTDWPSNMRLAFILLDTDNKQGTLNQLLVTSFIKHMVNSLDNLDVNCLPVRSALQKNTFNVTKYTEKAYDFARMLQADLNQYIDKDKEERRHFFAAMFEWIGTLEKEPLDLMIQNALNLYLGRNEQGQSTSWFLGGKVSFFGLRTTRESEVVAYQKDCDYNDPQSKIAMIAKIFNKDAVSSTLSQHLFDLILKNMPESTSPSILAIQHALINSHADKPDKGILRQSFSKDLHELYSTYYSQPRTAIKAIGYV